MYIQELSRVKQYAQEGSVPKRSEFNCDFYPILYFFLLHILNFYAEQASLTECKGNCVFMFETLILCL